MCPPVDEGHPFKDLSPYGVEGLGAHNGSMTSTRQHEKSSQPTPFGSAPAPSDLARRVVRRREELGLTTEELAKRVGVDPTYLHYFENNADARLSFGTLNLIAIKLETSPFELAGGNIDRAPGRGSVQGHPSLESLTPEQCEAHLAAGGVGRIVLDSNPGPVALPVNYVYADGEVAFSTDQAKAERLALLPVIGFEIDRVDETFSEGWSVVVNGPVRHVTDPDELERLSGAGPAPWAGGDRNAIVKITPATMTGRVIVHDPPPDED